MYLTRTAAQATIQILPVIIIAAVAAAVPDLPAAVALQHL
jgi:hypothetical protein